MKFCCSCAGLMLTRKHFAFSHWKTSAKRRISFTYAWLAFWCFTFLLPKRFFIGMSRFPLRIRRTLLGPIMSSVIDDDAKVSFDYVFFVSGTRRKASPACASVLYELQHCNKTPRQCWLARFRRSDVARIDVCIIHGSKKHKTGWVKCQRLRNIRRSLCSSAPGLR